MKRAVWIALMLGLLLCACQKRARVPASPPMSAPPPAVRVDYLAEGDRQFEAGNHAGAILAYETYLHQSPANARLDTVLFRLGVSYAASSRPAGETSAVFKRLTKDFPTSPLSLASNLILKLYAELDKARADLGGRDDRLKVIQTELDRLKQIDLQRRRKP